MMLLDKEAIQKINLIENILKAKIKDLIEKEEKFIIIIEEGDLKKAIVDKGKNVKTVERLTHKRVKLVEFNQDPLKFVKSFIYPIQATSITLNNNIIEIKVEDRKSKGLLIGRNAKNLEELNSLINENYNLQVKIV